MLYPMEIDASEDIEDKVEDKPEEPVARRTRSAKRSCQNRSNLLLLIEWLSISNPILAAKLILERNDVIAKRIDGNLMVSPCKSEGPAIENIEFKGGFITHNYETINSISHQVRDEFFWQEISEEGEKFVEQMEKNLTKLFYR
uniref:Uncharacterized protein n=1 Tax=Wuchereria bancrofti TaxID=6293 RepID=A0AAF5PVG0_WUCBA